MVGQISDCLKDKPVRLVEDICQNLIERSETSHKKMFSFHFLLYLIMEKMDFQLVFIIALGDPTSGIKRADEYKKILPEVNPGSITTNLI